MNLITKLGASLALLLATALAWAAVMAEAGPYRISLETEPGVVALGNVKMTLTVTDAGGAPLDGLDVRVIARMPGMNMGERETPAKPVSGKPGAYEATQPFSMEGLWEVGVRIKGPKGEGSTTISLRTGQDTRSAAGGFSFMSLLPWLAGLILVAYVIVRVRATGQSISLGSIVNRATLTGVALLAVLLFGAIWAVNNLRRPGAMTPLEAQVMEMDTPPPPGTIPVNLAEIDFGEVAETVAYSGQAVGYVEQDVVPRVTGTIVSMPVYVGDRVAKGQVVARLDTSQLDPEVAEKAAMAATATRSVDVATSEHLTAMRSIAEARADLSVRQAAVEEAEAMRAASVQDRSAKQQSVVVAEARVEDAKAEIRSAEKDLDFWDAEVKRARELYDKGVIARANLQRTEADAAKAQTMVHHAHQGLRQAEAELGAARSELSRAESMIAAADKRIKQAQADVRAAEAAIRMRESEADAKRKAISREQAAVAQAQAGYRGATTMRGYTELRAESDGFVSKRVISPGTVVNPGQVVLQIAQVRPIRLQANVAEVDLAKVRVGTEVEIGSGPNPLQAKVSSVSPAVDPASRTAVVEVLYDNRDERFLPGQFVAMRFRTGAATRSLRVPSEALRPAPDEGEGKAVLWIAESSGESNEWTVRSLVVDVTAQGGKYAAVRSTELRAGLKVVLKGNARLREGDVVSAVEPEGAGGGPTVEVSASGFSPGTIEVEAGQPTTITFIRVSEEGCGTEVVFPDLGIDQPLPLNKPTPVTIHPNKPGTLTFSCGMNMLRGKVVVR